MSVSDVLEQLVLEVQASAKYRPIHVDLIRRLGAQELAKGRSLKEAVKATRNKLHQVGGAYQETAIPYPNLTRQLESLPHNLHDPAVRQFCLETLRWHTSTRERLPILERFYAETLAPLGPLTSVLDVACGFNPLSAAWMPLAPDAQYFACDIYADQVDFLNRFFAHSGLNGRAELCDLTAAIPTQPVQLALALKTIPCLEQMDKSVGPRLLAELPAQNLLVSFPARSLGGHGKGMVENYAAHFAELVGGKTWQIDRFEFSTELVFLVRK